MYLCVTKSIGRTFKSWNLWGRSNRLILGMKLVPFSFVLRISFTSIVPNDENEQTNMPNKKWNETKRWKLNEIKLSNLLKWGNNTAANKWDNIASLGQLRNNLCLISSRREREKTISCGQQRNSMDWARLCVRFFFAFLGWMSYRWLNGQEIGDISIVLMLFSISRNVMFYARWNGNDTRKFQFHFGMRNQIQKQKIERFKKFLVKIEIQWRKWKSIYQNEIMREIDESEESRKNNFSIFFSSNLCN